MAWMTLTLQVTTPLFNGGADPDGSAGVRPADEAGVRVASIRGAMRFWFRALAGCVTGTDLRLLAALERRVFGGAVGTSRGAEAGQPGTARRDRSETAASPLIMRIPGPPGLSHERSPDFLSGREAKWIGYLLGLGLIDVKNHKPQLLRPFVPAGQEFELRLCFRHDRRLGPRQRQAIEALTLASLWLMCAYGGVGARARRGFGGLRIIGAEGELPRPWNPRSLSVTGLDPYQRAESLWPATLVTVLQQDLAVLLAAEGRQVGPVDEWASPPPFPVLSQSHAPAALAPREFATWQQAAAYAGEQLRLYRANRPLDTVRRGQARVRTAEWDAVIKGDAAGFPLGALGLPVGYHEIYQDHRGKKQERSYVVNVGIPGAEGTGQLRRASPLWLRPVGAGDEWRLFTFAFQTGFLPGLDNAQILVWEDGSEPGGQNENLVVEQDDVRRLTDQWVSAIRDGASFADTIRE